jgi:hemolysin III
VGEEIANGVTHGIAAVLAIAALPVMIALAATRGDAWRVTSLAIYGSTLVLLFLASTLYHALRRTRLRWIFRRIDHGAIFLLIAGTYTPVTLVHLRGPWGWTLFGVIWGLALAGIVAKAFLGDRLHGVAIGIYIAMGWMVLIAAKPVLTSVPRGLLVWLAIGGVCYTLGVAFYVAKRLPYHHAVWHLFVLAGSACHCVGMLLFVTPA